jgi:glutamine amidotransferase
LRLADRNDLILLHQKLKEINCFGELNLGFSDGTYLFAYHDRSGYVGLNFLLRHAPYKVVRLRGQYLTVDLADIIDPEERGYIVASQPLSDENWLSFVPGQLLVFSEGNVIFMSGSE